MILLDMLTISHLKARLKEINKMNKQGVLVSSNYNNERGIIMGLFGLLFGKIDTKKLEDRLHQLNMDYDLPMDYYDDDDCDCGYDDRDDYDYDYDDDDDYDYDYDDDSDDCDYGDRDD